METGRIDRLVQVGIRCMNGHQREQAEKFGVEVHEMKDWQGLLKFCFDGPLYISFDMDALDPAFAPGVSHREPGGLGIRDVYLVEYNPVQDLSGLTAMTAAKIMKELMGKIVDG